MDERMDGTRFDGLLRVRNLWDGVDDVMAQLEACRTLGRVDV